MVIWETDLHFTTFYSTSESQYFYQLIYPAITTLSLIMAIGKYLTYFKTLSVCKKIIALFCFLIINI